MNQINIAYYDDDGMLYAVYPRNYDVPLYEDRDIAYHADIINVKNVMYDLRTIEGINAVPIIHTPPTDDILNLSYILKIYCGSLDNPELVPAMVDKTIKLMLASNMLWRSRDYLQVIRNYYRHGMYQAGDKYESDFRSAHPDLFVPLINDDTEKEHESTKRYFVKKNERKKHRP